MTPSSVEAEFLRELQEIEAESIGWIPLDEGVYLHMGSDEEEIQIVGVAHASMAHVNVLWLV
jgi:hypothetical protein